MNANNGSYRFEFSENNTNWYEITSASPKWVANKTYLFHLTNGSAHPWRVFDSQGFSRLVKTATNGASGNVADGFYGGDVTLTVTLNDNAPFSFDCATHNHEGQNNAFLYNGTCTECAQPNMYVRLNMDPATLPAPPAWPSNVPEVQVRFRNDGDFYFGPPGSVGNVLARGKIDFPNMSGVVSGLVLRLYGVTASQSTTSTVMLLRSPT